MTKAKRNPEPVAQLFDNSGMVVDKIYMLDKGQYIDSPVKPNAQLYGPGLVHVERTGYGMTRAFEGEIYDRDTWEWIERLMQVGYASLNIHKLLTKVLEDHIETLTNAVDNSDEIKLKHLIATIKAALPKRETQTA